MRSNAVATIAAFLLLGGCVSNGYKQFYQPMAGATPDKIAAFRAGPPPSVPKLDRSGDDPQAVAAAYARYGYAPIGASSFNGAVGQSEQNAVEQGAKVGADVVVVLSPKYAGSKSTVIPITTPTSQTSYTTGSATAYGSGGSATAYGNATTTTYGSQTNYIPITVDRFNYGAIYFIKRHYIFGLNVRDLDDSERQRIQKNRGLYVLSVVNGTPAFDSDILVGDILLSVNGQSMSDRAGFSDQLAAYKGQKIEVSILRGDALITKSVTLGN